MPLYRPPNATLPPTQRHFTAHPNFAAKTTTANGGSLPLRLRLMLSPGLDLESCALIADRGYFYRNTRDLAMSLHMLFASHGGSWVVSVSKTIKVEGAQVRYLLRIF